jgi:hypothetical protein
MEKFESAASVLLSLAFLCCVPLERRESARVAHAIQIHIFFGAQTKAELWMRMPKKSVRTSFSIDRMPSVK